MYRRVLNLVLKPLRCGIRFPCAEAVHLMECYAVVIFISPVMHRGWTQNLVQESKVYGIKSNLWGWVWERLRLFYFCQGGYRCRYHASEDTYVYTFFLVKRSF